MGRLNKKRKQQVETLTDEVNSLRGKVDNLTRTNVQYINERNTFEED